MFLHLTSVFAFSKPTLHILFYKVNNPLKAAKEGPSKSSRIHPWTLTSGFKKGYKNLKNNFSVWLHYYTESPAPRLPASPKRKTNRNKIGKKYERKTMKPHWSVVNDLKSWMMDTCGVRKAHNLFYLYEFEIFHKKFVQSKKRRKSWLLDNNLGHYIPLSHDFIILNVIIYETYSLSKKIITRLIKVLYCFYLIVFTPSSQQAAW